MPGTTMQNNVVGGLDEYSGYQAFQCDGCDPCCHED
jgi:hypothetical protein